MSLFKQIQASNTRTYKSDLTEKDLSDFFYSISKQPKPKEYIVYIGDYMSRYLTAYHNNDTVELAKLYEEALISLTTRLMNISNNTNIPYDIIYLLSKTYSLHDRLLSGGHSWDIYTSYSNESEYDTSSEGLTLYYRDSKWVLEKYWSDGFYTHDVKQTYELSVSDLFDLVLDYKKYV